VSTEVRADSRADARIVRSVHGVQTIARDPDFEIALAASLRDQYGRQGLIELYARFAQGDGYLDTLMRKAIWRAAAKSCGHGLHVGSGVGFKHLETFEIGDGVFVGAQAYIQGRFDGTCVLGRNTWIGPQSYFDARDLVLGEFVGWGPGAKVLGSSHTGTPVDVPIVQTDLEIRPVRIDAWADIGTNAVILPGVHIGKGAMVGAGAVVTSHVEPFAIVAGVPAKFLRWRTDAEIGISSGRTGESVHAG
jgi:galactoside O-acetyltransferase